MPRTATSIDMSRRTGAEIRRTRKQLGVTQAELAGRLGVTPAYITNVEAGRANLTIGQLANIAAALGAALDITLPVVERQTVVLSSPPAGA